MSLQGIGAEILEIVDANGVLNATGPSPLTRFLRLKEQLDREVTTPVHETCCLKEETAQNFFALF